MAPAAAVSPGTPLPHDTTSQLLRIQQAYDHAIDTHDPNAPAVDPLAALPEHIRSHPAFPSYARLMGASTSSSDGPTDAIAAFLQPREGMQFVDLGCSLALMMRNYGSWPCTYHGVDISSRTIQLLKNYVRRQGIVVGSLECAGVHQTPFPDNRFDIGVCVGVLEYYEREYVRLALVEAHRILKPHGRLVLDIPNTAAPECRVMMMIEEHRGRPELFDLTVGEFEGMAEELFEISRKQDDTAMVQYCLTSRKP